MKKILLLSLMAAALAIQPAGAGETKVTDKMVRQAVQGWCDGLLKISRTAMKGGDAKAVASEVIDSAYDYDDGEVLFKPTLTFGDQTFRLTKEGALAYFVGDNPKYPNDSGFALKNWTKTRFTVAGIITEGDIGIYMGNVTFTDKKGKSVTVDKLFVFRFDSNGKPKIIVHKSALPFDPAAAKS